MPSDPANTTYQFQDDHGHTISGVHSAAACAGRPCVIHHAALHHMRDWPLRWRESRGTFERICPHGVAHPDPDDRLYQVRWLGKIFAGTHHCDGCCEHSG